MQYRYLGRSALKVSPLCLGAMMFGRATDEATAQRIVAKAFGQGINFIDTADVYAGGRSEEIVGHAIATARDRWVLATKFGFSKGEGPNEQGQSRKWIIETVHGSLRRLGTDYIDLLYFHRALPDVTLEEGIRTVGDLIRQGKVRYWGVSNFRAWRIAEAVRVAERLEVERPIASQPLYNIVERSAEVEELPAAGYYGLGVVPYSPLARGVLTGKYRAGAPPPADSRAARGDKRIRETEYRPESMAIAAEIVAHAAVLGIGPVAYALAWVLRNRLVSAVIAGPRTEEQWDRYAEALEVKLGPAEEAFIDSLVAPGHPSTPGFTDPQYPVEGRRVDAD
ncbi:MAG: aldo/keto reductase [Gammaproteobacteria bacterium]